MISINKSILNGIVFNDVKCLSTDTKPTSGIRNGSTLTEIDTGDRYMFDAEGVEWHKLPASGGGGGGGIVVPDWKDSFSVNWDFSNPVNTNGLNRYESLNTATKQETIDGWFVWGGIATLVDGGIKLERLEANTAAYFIQQYKQAPSTGMIGKTFTLSCIVDGFLNSYTAPIPSMNSGTPGTLVNGVTFRIWTYYGPEVAVTIDIKADTGDHVIQAVKLEAGSTQTLATEVNGVWVLNNVMDHETEYDKARIGLIYPNV